MKLLKTRKNQNIEKKLEVDISKLKYKSNEEMIFAILIQNGLNNKFKRNPRTRAKIPNEINKLFDDDIKLGKIEYSNAILSKISNEIVLEKNSIFIKFTPIVIVTSDANTVMYKSVKMIIDENTNEISIVNNVNKFVGNALDLSVKLINKKEIRRYDKYGIEMEKHIYNLEKDINNLLYSDVVWYNGNYEDSINEVIWQDIYDEYNFETSLKRKDVLCVKVNTKGKYYSYRKQDSFYLIDYDNIDELGDVFGNDVIDYDVWNNVLEVQEEIKEKTMQILKLSKFCNINNPYFKGIIKLAKKYGYNIDELLAHK